MIIKKLMDAGDQENFEISSFLGAPKLDKPIYGHKKNTAGGSWVAGELKEGLLLGKTWLPWRWRFPL